MLTCAALVLLALTQVDASSVSWGYDNNGPSRWFRDFPTCGSTLRQSPIDIDSSKATVRSSLGDITMTGYDKPIAMTIRNNGHTAQVDITSGDAFIENGGLQGKYRLLQMHMHWGDSDAKGSEHTINKEQFPMEMHLVHVSTDVGSVGISESLAVIGFMFEISDDDNEQFSKITSKLSMITQYSSTFRVALGNIVVRDLLPNKPSHFYRYRGSLTTPGCDEIVVWSVFRETIKISNRQLAQFRTLMSSENSILQNNFRPTQPLSGRDVQVNIEDSSEEK